MFKYTYEDCEKKYIDVEAYYALERTGFDMKPHRHPYIEIMYVEIGGCIIDTYSGNRVIPHKMSKGQFIVIASGHFHKLFISPNETCTMYTIEMKFIEENKQTAFFPQFCTVTNSCPQLMWLFSAKEGFQCLFDSDNLIWRIKKIMHLLDRYKTQHKPEDRLLYRLELYSLLISIVNISGQDFESIQSMAYIKKARDIITSQFDKPDFNISFLADTIGIHKVYLMNLYKKYIGVSIARSVQELRIQKATVLLRDTDMPVIDISMDCGYNSRQSFFLSFKKVMGISPLEYRKECGQLNLHSYDTTYEMQWFPDDD